MVRADEVHLRGGVLLIDRRVQQQEISQERIRIRLSLQYARVGDGRHQGLGELGRLVGDHALAVVTLEEDNAVLVGLLGELLLEEMSGLGGLGPFGGIVLHPQVIEEGQNTGYGRESQPQPEKEDEDPGASEECNILLAEVLPH